jgi:starvation-inducible DNA-binding protein
MATNNGPVVTMLEKALADTYTLALKTQNYHWNVTGADFFQLHGMFEEQYGDLSGAVDELAERIRALGQLSPGGLKAFQALTQIEDGDGSSPALDMVRDLAKDHEAVSTLLSAAVAVSEENNDVATADMLTGRLAVHQKTAWMLNATAAR